MNKEYKLVPVRKDLHKQLKIEASTRENTSLQDIITEKLLATTTITKEKQFEETKQPIKKKISKKKK